MLHYKRSATLNEFVELLPEPQKRRFRVDNILGFFRGPGIRDVLALSCPAQNTRVCAMGCTVLNSDLRC